MKGFNFLVYYISILFFSGLIVLIKNKTFFLVRLLGLEFCGLGVFILRVILNDEIMLNFYYRFYLLGIIVCERSLGLSLLIIMAHRKGVVNMNRKIIILC